MSAFSPRDNRLKPGSLRVPGAKYQGQIDHLQLKMNRQTRTQGIVATVNNPDRQLRPGMFGRIEISVQVVKQAIVCPTDAVVRSRTGNYLLVQRMPGKYENRPVKLGLSENGHVEVLEGVFPGDQVVVVGNALLAAAVGQRTQSPGRRRPAADRTRSSSRRERDCRRARHD